MPQIPFYYILRRENNIVPKFSPIVHYEQSCSPVMLQSIIYHYLYQLLTRGARGGLVVKALRYKPAGRGFDSR